jgi:hypothetical protein
VSVLILIAVMNFFFIIFNSTPLFTDKRYKRGNSKNTGIVKFVNGKTLNYMVVALLLGGVFGFIVWNVGGSPDINGSFTANANIGLMFYFFGLLSSLYLDQKNLGTK